MGQYHAGESGNPRGRPKGSYGGRIQALAGLDRLLSDKKCQKTLIAALRASLMADPEEFFKTVIMPLLPREARLEVERDGVIEWKGLLGDEPGEKPRFDAHGNPIPENDRR